MNPEFERNLWIEMSTRRIVLMPVVLGLIFLAAWTVSGHDLDDVGKIARGFYYLIVMIWGSRAAAGAVVNEIRERTWDGQRLSAISPSQMLAGKLLGVTSFQWYGGLICLLPILASRLKDGLPATLSELIYFLSVGLFAQSAALFASLVAIRRRADQSRFDIFLFMATGVIVGWLAAELWNVSYLTHVMSHRTFWGDSLDRIRWFGNEAPTHGFYLVSLAAFLGWSLLGNLTLLRAELQVRTGPLPWLSFMLFMIVYCAGFADGMTVDGQGLQTLRITIAIGVATALTYVSIFFESKNPVLYRWMLNEFGRGRVDHILGALQAWMMSFVVLTGLVIYQAVTFTPPLREIFGYTEKLLPILIAGYFFVARDVGVFLYFNLTPQARRGDFAAIVALGVLYMVFPALLKGLSFGAGDGLLALAFPYPADNTAFMIAAPACEAAVMWAFALSRLKRLLGERGAVA